MTPEQARALFLDHCQPGDRGALERYGEKAAVAAILAAVGERKALSGEDAWFLLIERLGRDPHTSQETDTCSLRSACKAMLAFRALANSHTSESSCG